MLLTICLCIALQSVAQNKPVSSSKDSLIFTKDTTLRISKDTMDAPVSYNASDSGVMDLKTKVFYLFGKAKTVYKSSQLEAATIVYDQQSQNIKAYGTKDTSGNPLSNPKFTEADIVSYNDSIYFNMKTGKGLTKNTNFQQGEICTIYLSAGDDAQFSYDIPIPYLTAFPEVKPTPPHSQQPNRTRNRTANSRKNLYCPCLGT